VDWNDLGRWVPRIEAELERSYREARRVAPSAVADAVDRLREFTLRGGKRFRALLVLAGYGIATHRSPAPALPAAAALEQFQSWMLVHDDIMDHAETRRNGPTLHREFERFHAQRGWGGSAADFGIANGITLGDLAEPLTVEALLRARVPERRRMRALSEYARMTRETAYGQLLDIRLGALPIDEVREADVLAVHRRKSAVYTVASPLTIGASLGGASRGLRTELDRFGLDVGVAFQLRDDILGAGLAGDSSGKSANDLAEGKRTLLVVRAWEQLDGSGREALEAALGRTDASSEAVDRAREAIRRSGSLRYSEDRIQTLTNAALRRVSRSRWLREGDRQLLDAIADRLVHRTV
jgi:geranylgeranyl diphosphate synthase type I